MPRSLCLDPRCPHPATYRGRCQAHNRRLPASKNKQVYNTKRWAITRRRKLTLDPTCQRCGNQLADHVHHITDLQQGGDPWNLDNLESLCHSCHSAETRQRQTGATQ